MSRLDYPSLVRAMLAAALVLTVAAPVQAQPRVDRLVEQAAAEFEDQHLGEALAHYEEAAALATDPATQRGIARSIGRCLLGLGRYREALAAFDEYVRLGGDESCIRDQRREAHAALATLTLDLEPADAEVLVDGEPYTDTGSPRVLEIDPGSHRLEVRATGYASLSGDLSVDPGARRSMEFHPERAPVAAARIAIEPDADGAEIRVDGEVVATGTYESDIEVGEHDVEVRADGRETFRERVAARPGETVRVRAHLARVGEGGGENLAESPVLWTIVGIAVVGAAVGIGVGVYLSQPQVEGSSTGIVLMGLEGRF